MSPGADGSTRSRKDRPDLMVQLDQQAQKVPTVLLVRRAIQVLKVHPVPPVHMGPEGPVVQPDLQGLRVLPAQMGQRVIQGPTGPMGPTGPAGADGAPGSNGVGVPIGGTTGQILAKIDATDYNTQWVNPASGGASDWGDLGGTITDQTDLIAYLAATYLALGGGALTGRVDFKPGNSTSASFRIPGGTAPSSPAHGDVYASGGTNLRHLSLQCVVLHELHQQARDLHREEDVQPVCGRRGTDQPRR